MAPFGTDDAEASSASSLTERPSIARQTSLKELASASRKSCEAIPEEAKEADGPAASSSSASTTPVTPHGDAEAHLQPLPRDRVYTMPALNLRRANVDLNPRRSLVGGALDSAQKEAAGSVSGTNPRFGQSPTSRCDSFFLKIINCTAVGQLQVKKDKSTTTHNGVK